jgi:FMN phosphatase YigB (HAD superfamily)
MIGNNYQRDVEGAHAAGLTAIWFHWNDRYPVPLVSAVARYEARTVDELAEAIWDWSSSLPS